MPDIFKGNPRLETKRLILRKLDVSDAPDIYAYASDEAVSQYMLWSTHRCIEDAKTFINYTLKRYGSGDAGEWGIVLKETNTLIGSIGFPWYDIANSRAEIGYVLARPYWGQSLMPEAAGKIIEFAFDEMNLNRIECCHFAPNEKSGRVMRKLGMKYEGTAWRRIFAKGCFWDVRQYALLREDWEHQRSIPAHAESSCLISSDKSLLDIDRITAMLSTSYWANSRSREAIAQSIAHSLCWGAYQNGVQVAFARAVTDYAIVYWLCDVIVDEEWRGRGIGKTLVEAVVTSEELAPLRGILATRDAHFLYDRFGFKRFGDRFMMRSPG